MTMALEPSSRVPLVPLPEMRSDEGDTAGEPNPLH
jgi:hypothetical protein